MNRPQAYVRSMDGWWRRDPYFVRYMIREWSSAFFAIYAIILLVGVYRLSQGEAAYSTWLSALASPASILFHCVMLLFALYHTWTWFKVMPKTMPLIFVNGRKLPPLAITVGGLALALGATVVVLCLAIRGMP